MKKEKGAGGKIQAIKATQIELDRVQWSIEVYRFEQYWPVTKMFLYSIYLKFAKSSEMFLQV